ncbi:kinase-like domain-containing protein, partial [Linnemannia elongata]
MHKQVHDAEYIVKHFGITKHPLTHDTCIVMQFAGNGCLQDFLKTKNSSITWLKKYHLAWEIASGLDFIHREDIFHTNLHSRNILIDSRGKALITDFGLSKSVNNTIYTTKSGLFGVVPYVAPERMQNPTYTYNAKCDIYSLGVILWELSSCVIPFEAQLQDVMLAVNIIAGVREKTVPGTAVEYEMLYRRCWDGLPQNRPNMEFVLSELNGPLVAGESMIA